MPLTGSAIKALIHSSDNEDDFCEKLAQAIRQNIEVKVPPGTVIIAATGGVPNPAPINCLIS